VKRIDKVFSVIKKRSFVIGVEIDFSKNKPSDECQWWRLYLQILFWEFSILLVWNTEEATQ